MKGKELVNLIDSQKAGELFVSLYGGDKTDSARERYRRLVEGLIDERGFPKQDFPESSGELRIFSVPGRTELGGNHTDHNRGKVLAASIHLDAVAVVAARQDKQIFFRSTGHRDVRVDLTDLSLRESERGDTEALIRGIAAEFSSQGTPVGGFTANAESLVFTGSGLSSSAAIEVLFSKIFDVLHCGGKRSFLDLAKIGQKAENVYFGKPCGLMDQSACAAGGAVAIDFKDPQNPKVSNINFDPEASGFALCVVNTRGSHSDLTPDYAAIPKEMKDVAAFFGKAALRELDEETIMPRIAELRQAAGDRAILRAFHFFSENKRVDAMQRVLENMGALQRKNAAANDQERKMLMGSFLALVRESGDSSWELLQNIYSTKNPASQGLGLALALTNNFLKTSGAGSVLQNGAARVHGGGFAGTIQAYIPLDALDNYRKLIEGVFGNGTLTVLRIRQLGAIELEIGMGNRE